MRPPVSAINLNPIGTVRNGIHASGGSAWEETVAEIIIRPELIPALDGLEGFSHIIVVFWTGRSGAPPTPLKIHPRHNPGLPLLGLFSTRSPDRPNPVCITIVALLERRDNVLKVRGLDAFDGTAVIDIKPYLPGDLVREAQFPSWV